MTVKAVKLMSGEEVVGEVIHEENDVTTLKNVLMIMIQRDKEGNLNIGFVPFAPYLGKEATFEFSTDKVMFVKEVDTQMANMYNSVFGGIVTPPKTLILG
jgi:hypothetical protein